MSLDFAAEFSSGLATYVLASSAAVGAGRRLQSAGALIGWFLREETTEIERGPAERTGWMQQVAVVGWELLLMNSYLEW